MKSISCFVMLVCALSFASIGSSSAGELHNDYANLEIKRQQLEKLRADFEGRLDDLTVRVKIAAAELKNCIDLKSARNIKRKIWESRLKQFDGERALKENERQALNKLSKALQSKRLNLEARRSEIENKYRNKSRGDAYEAEFRQYMKKLKKEYFDAIENRLCKGYQSYIQWAGNYLSFLTESLEMCQKKDPSLFFADDNTTSGLQNEYQRLVERRRKMEKERIDYETQFETLASRVREGITDLNQCIRRIPGNTLKRSVWDHRINEIEAVRVEKEKKRRDLNVLKEELEDTRRRLEAERVTTEKRYSGKRSESGYEEGIRNYLKKMKNNYLNRIENELFAGYADYLIWNEQYITFLNETLSLCKDAAPQ